MVLDMMPSEPEAESVGFDLELNALDRVVIAAGVKDVRYYLNGVMFDLSDGVLAGSDGHRLHCYKNRVPSLYPRKETERVEVIFGRAPLKWMLDSADETARVTVWNATRPEAGGRHYLPQAMLRAGDGFVFIRKAIDGRFPDWRRFVPSAEKRPVVMTVDPVKLADTVAAMGKLVTLKTLSKMAGVQLDVGRGCVYGRTADQMMPLAFGLSSDRADIDLDALADDLWVAANAAYLVDLADCVTAGARWHIAHENGQREPLLVIDGDFAGMVMPLRNDIPARLKQAPVKAPEAPAEAPVVAEAEKAPAEAPEAPQQAPAEAEAVAA
jgi:DNA polymerase-3 subunit beta